MFIFSYFDILIEYDIGLIGFRLIVFDGVYFCNNISIKEKFRIDRYWNKDRKKMKIFIFFGKMMKVDKLIKSMWVCLKFSVKYWLSILIWYLVVV